MLNVKILQIKDSFWLRFWGGGKARYYHHCCFLIQTTNHFPREILILFILKEYTKVHKASENSTTSIYLSLPQAGLCQPGRKQSWSNKKNAERINFRPNERKLLTMSNFHFMRHLEVPRPHQQQNKHLLASSAQMRQARKITLTFLWYILFSSVEEKPEPNFQAILKRTMFAAIYQRQS